MNDAASVKQILSGNFLPLRSVSCHRGVSIAWVSTPISEYSRGTRATTTAFSFYLQDMDFVSSMVERYMTASSRYTNILFIGFADKVLGWYNPAVLPALMITLFVAGIYLFIDQIQQFAGARFSRGVSFYLAALLAYYSIVQAPDCMKPYIGALA